MLETKCSRCNNTADKRDLHPINFSDELLCDDCYTEEVKKEEEYYDYCLAKEYRYDTKDGNESRCILNDKKFFRK